MQRISLKLAHAGFPGSGGDPLMCTEGDTVYDEKGHGFICHQAQHCGARPCTNCPAHRGEKVWYREPKSEEIEYQLGKLMSPILKISEWGINQSTHGFTFSVVIDDRKIDTAGGKTAQETLAMAWIRIRDYFIERSRMLKTTKDLGFDIYG